MTVAAVPDTLLAAGPPGAALDGKYAGLGDFAQAIHHRNKTGRTAARQLQNALQERVPSQGGFLVPEELRSDIMYATLEEAIIRPLATVIPVDTLRVGLPIVDDTSHASSVLGGWNFAWTEESAALALTAPAYGRVVYEAKKLTAYTVVNDELVADGPALQAFLRTTVPMALAWAEDNAFIQGSGTGQPQGILNAPCAVNVSRAGGAGHVIMTDILSMLTRILPQSMKHCIWLCSPDVLQQILQAYLNVGGASAGSNITPVAPPGWLMGSPTDGWTLLGRPLIATEHCPALGTRGDLMLCDPRFYVIADRVTMDMESSARGQKFAADETEFRFRSRVDGKIWLQSPVTPENSSATVSPVVILN